jgi:hypothetical protein
LFATFFSFNNESFHDCRLERGGWYSIGSVIGYWLAWLIVCNLPRSEDGCFLKKRRSLEDENKIEGDDKEADEEESPAVEVVDEDTEAQTVAVVVHESEVKKAKEETPSEQPADAGEPSKEETPPEQPAGAGGPSS